MQERRKYERINISFPVECFDVENKNFFYTVTKDLSLGGTKIVNDKFLPKDNFLKVNLNLIDKILTLNAKVVWCNKLKFSDKYFVGLNFTDIEETSKQSLLNFISAINN